MFLGEPETTPRLDNIHRFMAVSSVVSKLLKVNVVLFILVSFLSTMFNNIGSEILLIKALCNIQNFQEKKAMVFQKP